MSLPEDRSAGFERLAANVLRVGVSASAALLAVGLGLWVSGLEPWATWVLDGGLLTLMATPAARVVVSFGAYLRARDWFFVATTAGILVVLLGSLISALAAH
jgi:uncharacterized membrane protein